MEASKGLGAKLWSLLYAVHLGPSQSLVAPKSKKPQGHAGSHRK